MPDRSETLTVKKSVLTHRCDWCGQLIEVGSTYQKWAQFDEGDVYVYKMHPECFTASNKTDFDDSIQPGDFRRGCWCGENLENCKCNEIEKQE